MIEIIKKFIEKNTFINLSDLSSLCVLHKEYFLDKPGIEPYKFYAFLSTLYDNSIILDIGSYFGNSALALSYNNKNKVISYDIREFGQNKIKKENITWELKDFRKDESIDYKKVKLILIDIEPHNGIKEKEMFNFLKEKEWSGTLVLDDIHLKEMNNFWNSINETKIDITIIGHHSGTGIVEFI